MTIKRPDLFRDIFEASCPDRRACSEVLAVEHSSSYTLNRRTVPLRQGMFSSRYSCIRTACHLWLSIQLQEGHMPEAVTEEGDTCLDNQISWINPYDLWVMRGLTFCLPQFIKQKLWLHLSGFPFHVRKILTTQDISVQCLWILKDFKCY